MYFKNNWLRRHCGSWLIATVGEGSGNASSSKEESSDQSQSANNDEATKELAQPTESQSNNEETQSNPNNQRVNATPSARRHARENGRFKHCFWKRKRCCT